MALVRMDIHALVVGGGPVASLVVLRTRPPEGEQPVLLPIRIGGVEATAISLGIGNEPRRRPATHDLLSTVVSQLGARLAGVAVVDVQGTTFFAQLMLATAEGERQSVDCRPSDAIALAVRAGAPIFTEESVLEAAALPDFTAVERATKAAELERFHDFVETLTPSDF